MTIFRRLMAHHPDTFAAGLIMAGQKLLVITGSDDNKATPWNKKCVPVWEKAGAKVVSPPELLDPSLIFPLSDQGRLTAQIEGYLAEKGNITFLTFKGVDHMASARKFFYIKAARRLLFSQVKG